MSSLLINQNGTLTMQKILITQSNYIPWKGYFDNIAQCDVFVVYDDMQYTKRDWRNRNYIKSEQGLKWLTIPVEVKGKYFQKINETVISDNKWNIDHWNQLEQNYRKAPFFKEFASWVHDLYLTASFQTLTEINVHFLKAICSFLEIKTRFIDSREFKLNSEDRTQRLVDICKEMEATDYYTGPSAGSYMDENLFEKEGVKLHYFNYDGYTEYKQPGPKFEHGVSMLDMIFNIGHDSKSFLKYLT
jgi:hypothetical protein